MCCPRCSDYPCRNALDIHVHAGRESGLPNPHYHFCRPAPICALNCRACNMLVSEDARLPLSHFRYGCCHQCGEYRICDFIANHKQSTPAVEKETWV